MVKSLDKEYNLIDQHENPWAIFCVYEPNLIYIKYKPGDDELDISFARQQVQEFKNLCRGIPQHQIVDFSNTHISFTPEARRFFAENEEHSKLRLTHAIIVRSLAQRIVANFYMKINKPKSPTKIVSNLEQAFDWLENWQ